MPTRRDFLQKLSGSIIALPLVSETVLAACDNPAKADDRVLRVAIMGLGGYANIVARAMKSSKKAKITGVISGTPSKIKTWQQQYDIPEKNCYNYDNFDAIKNNPDIDAVYIITPNALHKDEAIRVAQAGKHVICEKPMAISSKEGREMIDACKKANVKLLVGYRMHFEPHTLAAINMRKNGSLGRIRFFQGLSGFPIGDPTQWRLNKSLSGGGSMMDIGIYAVNGSRYMVGEEPVWVTAQETKTNPEKFKEGIDETITFQFGFPSGAVASCLSTYAMSNLDRFFLDGEQDYVEMWPATGYGPIKGHTGKGDLNQPITIHQAVQMDEMSDIIFNNKQPEVPVDGEEGLKDLLLIEAIYEAAQTGKKIQLGK